MTTRIIWKEGMALAQQHFQQADVFAFAQMRDLAGYTHGLNFGFRELEFSTSAFSAGVLQMERCHALFKGGYSFTLEGNKAFSIESRSFGPYFSPECMALRVYLGHKSGVDYFNKTYQSYVDPFDPSQILEIEVGTPAPRILFEGESTDGYECIPLARLVRNAQGSIVLDPSFTPPLIAARAYVEFTRQIENFKIELNARIIRIQAFKPSCNGNNLGQFLLLQSLQSFAATLETLWSQTGCVPFHIFLEMARFVGNLQVFRSEQVALPRYEHEQMGESFQLMFAVLRKLMETEQNNAYSGRRMEREGQMAYVADIDGLGFGLGKNAYLAIESSLSADELSKAFPVQAKIAPRSKLQALVVSAMQGITSMATVPPSGVQPAADTHFFKLLSDSSLWDDLIIEQKMGIYAPAPLQIRSIGIVVENPQ